LSMTESRRAAVGLIRRGIAVIAVPSGEKNPNRPGWHEERITEEDVPLHWTNGQNVGLLCGEPSGGRVDVDLDADEAVRIAGRFLPPTLTSGRESRPHSHWWYVCADAESCDWNDTDGSKVVELRSTGRQTLVAPSTHPDGDEYVWHAETGLKMAEIGAQELTRRLRELASAALIARHLPPIRTGTQGGGRHDYALALTGFLLRPGRFGEDLTLKVLKAAWDANGWPGEKERREAHRDLEGIVSDTAENLAAGEPVVGGPTLEEIAPGIVRLMCKWWRWERKAQAEKGEEKEERRNQADRLIGYALEDVQELFVDQHGAPHALIDGEPVPLTSRCYSWLRRLMWEEEGRSVSGEYLKMAAGTLSAQAEFSGDVRELYTRAAWHEGVLYYELRPGKVVRVGPGGWTFEAKPPVLFRRYVNLKALPEPKAGSSLDVLDELVNLKSERDRRLFKAYLVTLPLEHVGRPIFNASGAMGSGKTTVGRVVKRTWDPTAPETVRFDPRDFLQKAMHAYIVMLDNQNTIPEWASDTLCRLVTGEADSKRRLYTDDEDFVIELRRAVLLNGINVPTDRGDVLDRSLVVELERIPDGERKTEEELWERFEAEHPKLLGALFDTLSKAIALKRSLKLSRRPRLADWGEYAAAVYEVMGWSAEQFLSDWDEIVKVQNRSTLDGSPVAQTIIKFMEDRESFEGSSTELHKKLENIAEEIGVSIVRDKAWPKSARWLWRRIQEVVPLLVGVGIAASREHTDKGTQVALRKVPRNDVSNVREGESGKGKAILADNSAGVMSGSNVRSDSNVRSNVRANPAKTKGSDNTDNTDIRYGDFSETSPATSDDDGRQPETNVWENDPMRHYGRKGGAA
jgi:Bifunctional DNA primase/polymerase, N-terminal